MRYLFLSYFGLIFLATAPVPSQTYRITGIVRDSLGMPIAGVSVQEKLHHAFTLTAPDGSFSLTVSSEQIVLVFQKAGFEPQEIKINSHEKSLDVRLKFSGQVFNEVVVTGYPPAHKEDIVGSVQLVAPRTNQYKTSSDKENDGYYQKERNNAQLLDSEEFNTEEYDVIRENRFLAVKENPLSTFSIDVDGGSYSNVRRFLLSGQWPPAGAVRIEELINYFHYNYPQPTGNDPFSIQTEISSCSWNPNHQLLMIGLQGKTIPTANLPPSNLVFLIDVSGSMFEPEKLPLVQRSLKLLVDQLREKDRVSLVAYAGNAGLVLASTPGSEKEKIKQAIDRLEAGGSTAGGAGIELAYKIAEQNFMKQGNNRVILCTDGDFNVGSSSDSELDRIIEKEKKTGVFLTVLGYGVGNYKDSKMEKLADEGNGNHSYIDNEMEARKVLVNEFGGTLFTIAKDVKLQIEFNPALVQSYRLIGYENRMLNKEDFNNDQKDAGELGSGHTVTALYEIIPVGVKNDFIEKVEPLKYQKKNKTVATLNANELATIKFRYKEPTGDESRLIERAVTNAQVEAENTSSNFRFVSAVAQFGMVLRNSAFKEQASFASAYVLAKNALGQDSEGYRTGFLQLIKGAGKLAKNKTPQEDKEVSAVR